MPGTKICGFADVILIFLIGFGLTGCNDSGVGTRADSLVQVGDSVITADAFNQAFDMSGYGSAHGDAIDSQALAAAKWHLLNQLIEELIIIERARELNITVSDPELEAEILNTQKSYPEDTFDKTFLENAIFFKTWKERVRRQMLMKKVIARELEEQVLITPDDIRLYYHDHPSRGNERAEHEEGPDEIDLETVSRLRRDKAIQAYPSWIKALYAKYQIRVNRPLWDQMTDSPAGDTGDGAAFH